MKRFALMICSVVICAVGAGCHVAQNCGDGRSPPPVAQKHQPPCIDPCCGTGDADLGVELVKEKGKVSYRRLPRFTGVMGRMNPQVEKSITDLASVQRGGG